MLLSRVQGVASAAALARRDAAVAQAERDRLARELAAEKERLATAQAQAEAERVRQEALRLQKELEALRRPQQEQAMPSRPEQSGVGEMVFIPAGEFMMGSNDGNNDEKPVHRVYVDGFWMDKYEVTNAAYGEFVRAKGHRAPSGSSGWNTWGRSGPPSGMENHPVVNVSWEDARAYCAWAGKRLPSEAEWEKAARGGKEGQKYPWGNSISSRDANYGQNVGSTTPVGSYPANGYGLYDMSGNVWEWVSDWYDANYYSKSPSRNPTGSISGTYRVLRGGSWSDHPDLVRVACRIRSSPVSRLDRFGFRCARN